jgi:hypothetical protein
MAVDFGFRRLAMNPTTRAAGVEESAGLKADLRMEYPIEELLADVADVEAGRVSTVPGDEVRRIGHAL